MDQFLNYSDVDLLRLLVSDANYSLPVDVDFLEVMESPELYLTGKKAKKVAAVQELYKRRSAAKAAQKKNNITDSKTVYNNYKHLLEFEKREKFFVLFLNRKNEVKGIFEASAGGVSGTVVDVRIIAKKAIMQLASGVIVMHNHPSGNLSASTEDHNVTKKLKETLSLFDVNVLDHLIVTDSSYTSFADEGML